VPFGKTWIAGSSPAKAIEGGDTAWPDAAPIFASLIRVMTRWRFRQLRPNQMAAALGQAGMGVSERRRGVDGSGNIAPPFDRIATEP
jgi:hypothetical protein